MTVNYDELSRAIVLYVGYGFGLVPTCDARKLVSQFGEVRGEELLKEAVKLTTESAQISIDWTVNTLESAGQIASAEMQRRYPSLSPQALGAIAWKFTYDWR